MLKRSTPAKVEMIDCDSGADTPRKVFQLKINGTPVMVPADQLPELDVFPPDYVTDSGAFTPAPVLLKVTMFVSEFVIRAACDEDLQEESK